MRNPFSRRWSVVAALVLMVIVGGALPALAETVTATGELPVIFLRSGGTPRALVLDTSSPTAKIPKFEDSASVAFSEGNPWNEIGTWTSAATLFTGTVSGLNPLHVFVGLKDSDDEGTRFDLRAEVYRNGLPVTTGELFCATGVTRDPDNAKEFLISFPAFPGVAFGAADGMSVKVLTRIGTNGSGAACGGPVSSVGLRLYFDAYFRAARFEMPSAEGVDWATAIGGNSTRTSLSRGVGPTAPSVAWLAGSPASFSSPSVTENGLVVFSTLAGVVEAHDLGTGTLRWTAEVPAVFPVDVRVDAIRDGRVYATPANGPSDYIYCLDAADGSILWRSQDSVGEFAEESIAFTSNDDLIVGDLFSLRRINHVDGSTVWRADRFCGGSGSCMASVLFNRVYVWDMSAGLSSTVVSAFDVTNGEKLYSSGDLGVGGSQSGLLVGPDASVYCSLDSSPPVFIALRDTGSALTQKWRSPVAYTPFASHGIGPDGSVYTYSADDRILRLDPENGRIRDTSSPIPFGLLGVFIPRIAIDAAGKVFLTNCEDSVFSFDADLTLRWSANLTAVFPGGLTLARDGTLLVTSFEGLRAYRAP